MRRSNGKNKVFVVVLSLFMIFSSTNTTLFALTETASADKTDAQVEEMAADAELQEENVQEQAENTESTDAVETADEEVAADAETAGEEEAVAEETAAPFKDDNAPVRIGRSALLAAATPGDPEKTEPDTPADPTFITISKTFIGIEEAPADFRIKVDGKAYDLSSAAKDGLSYTWKIGANAGTHTVDEENAEVEGYELTPSGLGNVTTREAGVVIVEKYIEHACNKYEYSVGSDIGFMVAAFTDGTFVIWSKDTFTAAQREAFIEECHGFGGKFQKMAMGNCAFYSGDKLHDKIMIRGTWVQLLSDGTLKFEEKDQWNYFATGDYKIEGSQDADLEVTNTYEKITTSVEAVKTWDDSEMLEIEGYERPESIIINLIAKADGEIVEELCKTQEVKGDATAETWRHEFTGLPKTWNGKEVTYSITENNVPGYTTEYTDATHVVNTPNTELYEDIVTKVDLEISKVDESTGNELGGAEFTVTRCNSEGTPIGDAAVVNGNETFTFPDAGNYIIVETKAPAGYEKNKTEFWVEVKKVLTGTSYDAEKNVGYYYYDLKITSATPEDAFNADKTVLTVEDPSTTVNVKVTKTWDDNGDQDKKRDSYGVTLYANGTPVYREVTLDKDTLEYSWKDLTAYRDGEKIAYTVDETTVPAGYDEPEVAAPVYDEESNTWVVAVTNSYTPGTTKVSGTKTWKDSEMLEVEGYERPESITINLIAKVDGEIVKDLCKSQEVKGDATAETWNFEFAGLPVNAPGMSGKQVDYSITENKVPGYTTTYTDALNVVNTPNTDLNADDVTPIDLKIAKVDENTGNMLDGSEFTVTQLSRDDEPEGEAVTVKGNDTFAFPDEGTYTIVETKAPAGYEINETEYAVEVERVFRYTAYDKEKDAWINYYDLKITSATPEDAFNADKTVLTVEDPSTTVDITAEKIWDDSSNKYGKRSDIEFTLYDGSKVADVENAVQTLGTEDGETCTWKNLPAYRDGEKIEYSVKETIVPDEYVSSTKYENAEVDADGNAVIINTYNGDNGTKDVTDDSTGNGPKTGDEHRLFVSLFALIAALLAAAYLTKERG